MQVVKVGNNRQKLGFRIKVFAENPVTFEFRDSLLTKMIHIQEFQKSKKSYALVQMHITSKSKQASVKINSHENFKHLAFNKGIKPKSKIPKVAGKGVRRNKVPIELKDCPPARRPDNEGTCSMRFPYKRTHEDTGKQCCYKKPTHTTGKVKTLNGQVYIDGKRVNTLSYSQLSKAAKSFGKKLLPDMKKRNIIQILSNNIKV